MKNPKNGKSTTVLALLDGGSDTDLISEELVNILQLEEKYCNVTITTINSTTTTRKGNVTIEVENIDSTFDTEIVDAIVSSILTGPSDIYPADHDLSKFSHLKDLSFDKAEWGVEILLGNAHQDAWTCFELRQGQENEPYARNGQFGWTIGGILGKKNQ